MDSIQLFNPMFYSFLTHDLKVTPYVETRWQAYFLRHRGSRLTMFEYEQQEQRVTKQRNGMAWFI